MNFFWKWGGFAKLPKLEFLVQDIAPKLTGFSEMYLTFPPNYAKISNKKETLGTNWGGGGGGGAAEGRYVVPSGSTLHPASRARAARTSFMSARAGRGKLPYCRRPASIRLVIARRWRSLSLVRSFSFSLSLLPFEVVVDASPEAAEAAAKPRGRRWGWGKWSELWSLSCCWWWSRSCFKLILFFIFFLPLPCENIISRSENTPNYSGSIFSLSWERNWCPKNYG